MVDLERHLRRNVPCFQIPQRIPPRKHETGASVASTPQHRTPKPHSHARTSSSQCPPSHHCRADHNIRGTVHALRMEIGVGTARTCRWTGWTGASRSQKVVERRQGRRRSRRRSLTAISHTSFGKVVDISDGISLELSVVALEPSHASPISG